MTARHEVLVKEYVRLQEQREHIDQQMDTLKAELRTLGVGSHPIAGVTVSIAANRRIDEARVIAEYPIAQYQQLYTAKPDPKKIRAELAPKVVDSLMREIGDPKVSIR